MSGSFRNIIQVSNKSAYEPATNKTLSIGFFPDGFVFAVLDNDDFQYIALEDYAILPSEHASPQQDFFLRLETFIRNHPILSLPFQKAYLAYYTPELILVPEDVYDDDHKHEYFSFCATLPKDHKLVGERMNILNARGIYAVPDDLLGFFEKMFPGVRMKHHGVVLIESTLAALKLEPRQVDLVVHLRKTHIEVLLVHKQQLKYYQSFSYQAFDDVLYYVFYVLEQHALDASKLYMLLMGSIAMDTYEYQTLAGFFKRVSFPERNDVFKYTEKFDNIPAHFYYTLLNLVACG